MGLIRRIYVYLNEYFIAAPTTTFHLKSLKYMWHMRSGNATRKNNRRQLYYTYTSIYAKCINTFNEYFICIACLLRRAYGMFPRVVTACDNVYTSI